MGYIRQKLWDILRDVFVKSYRFFLARKSDIFSQNYGIYWVKTMGYIRLKLWDIFGRNYVR